MFKKENEIARLKKEFNRLNTLAAQKITEELMKYPAIAKDPAVLADAKLIDMIVGTLEIKDKCIFELVDIIKENDEKFFSKAFDKNPTRN